MATPDVEADILAKLAALLPSTILIVEDATRNARAGPLRPTSNVGNEVFVQSFGGSADLHNDGRFRYFNVQITVRGARNDYTGAHALALQIHDALDLLGPFTGASSARYVDVRSQIAAPNYIGPDEDDQELFAEPFEVWFDGS